MKKRIILVLEVDNDEDSMMSDDYIKNDLETEINCGSNSYDVISFKTETLN